jgi:hypothetical protein
MRRSSRGVGDHIAIFIITFVSWLLLVFGAILCLDAFVPKSEPVSSVWPEFFLGLALLAVGSLLRVIKRRSF